MKRNKLLSLLLALCMVLSLLPAVASAETVEVTDTLDRASTGVTSTTYTDWSGKKGESGAVYAGQSAGGNESIQLRSSNSNSGIVTTTSGGKARKIAVEWNSNSMSGRTINVYGKNTAYTSPSELYNNSTQGTSLGTIVYGTSTELTVSGDYEYIGFRSDSGALYLTKVEITWEQEGGEPTETYTVTFESGIEGVDSIIYNEVSANYTLPDGTIFEAPEGKEFDQWVVKGTETKYDAGELVTLEGDTTFVAIWKDLPVTETKTYKKVTTEPTDWSGEYLIVYEDGNLAFNSSLTTLDAVSNTVEVEIVENEITIEDKYAFTIEKGDNNGYYVLSNSGYYFNQTSDSNGLGTSTSSQTSVTFSLNTDGSANIISSSAYLRFNSANNQMRFRFYKSSSYTGQKPIALYKLDEGSEPEVKPTFAKKNLVLSGEIGVNFYMDLPEIEGVNYEESYMTFEISGKGTTTVQDNFDATDVNQTGKYYGFTCYVNSIQMADTITATFHYGDGKTVSETYSVKQYVVDFDEYNDDSENEPFDSKTIAIVHAMADYGHYAQLFLSEKNSWTIGDGEDQYAEMTSVYTTSYSYTTSDVENKKFSKTITGSDISAITYSLALDSATEIRVFIKPAADYTGSITVTVDGGEAVNVTPEEKVSGRYLVKIPSISAHKLGDIHTITITTENENNVATVNVSALSYVYSMLKNYPTDTNAVNAMSALYAYSLAADAYNK